MCNVPSSVFWFLSFCFLPFVCRTSIQKWKKIWFCYAHKWIGKKEMLAKISKCLCWNLFIGATTQIRAVCKDHEIFVTLKRCITLSFKFLDLQHKVFIVLWLSYLQKHFLFIWRQCKHKYNNLVVIVREFMWDNCFQIMFVINIFLSFQSCH